MMDEMRLDFDERAEANRLEAQVIDSPGWAAATIVSLRSLLSAAEARNQELEAHIGRLLKAGRKLQAVRGNLMNAASGAGWTYADVQKAEDEFFVVLSSTPSASLERLRKVRGYAEEIIRATKPGTDAHDCARNILSALDAEVKDGG